MMDDSNIDHPDHYTRGKIEPIDVIEDWNLDFHLGQVLKYLSRAGWKDGVSELEDLKKARWYLNRRINLAQNQLLDQEIEPIIYGAGVDTAASLDPGKPEAPKDANWFQKFVNVAKNI